MALAVGLFTNRLRRNLRPGGLGSFGPKKRQFRTQFIYFFISAKQNRTQKTRVYAKVTAPVTRLCVFCFVLFCYIYRQDQRIVRNEITDVKRALLFAETRGIFTRREVP